MSEYRDAASAPLVVAGRKVTAIDQATGRRLWTYEELTRRALRFHVTNDRVFVLDWEGNLHCLRLSDGAVLGVVRLQDRGGEAALVPVGDRLYIFSNEKLTALDGQGKILWQTEIGWGGEWGLVGLGVPGNEIQPDFSRS